MQMSTLSSRFNRRAVVMASHLTTIQSSWNRDNEPNSGLRATLDPTESMATGAQLKSAIQKLPKVNSTNRHFTEFPRIHKFIALTCLYFQTNDSTILTKLRYKSFDKVLHSSPRHFCWSTGLTAGSLFLFQTRWARSVANGSMKRITGRRNWSRKWTVHQDPQRQTRR